MSHINKKYIRDMWDHIYFFFKSEIPLNWKKEKKPLKHLSLVPSALKCLHMWSDRLYKILDIWHWTQQKIFQFVYFSVYMCSACYMLCICLNVGGHTNQALLGSHESAQSQLSIFPPSLWGKTLLFAAGSVFQSGLTPSSQWIPLPSFYITCWNTKVTDLHNHSGLYIAFKD